MTSRILIIAPNHQFPRLAGFADDAAALRQHFQDRDPLNGLTPQALHHTQVHPRPPVADQPAADLGSAC